MEKKWLIRMCLVVGVLFGISGVAMAANNVQMTSDVPNINKSSCGEAGNQYLAMDNATQMQEGDIIQFTLNNNSSLCKAIDYYLLLANDSSFDLSLDTAEAVSTNHDASWLTVYSYSGSPTVYTTIPASTGGLGIDLAGDGSLWDVGLHVHGGNGDQIYTVQLVRRLLSAGLRQYDLQIVTNSRFVVKMDNNVAADTAYLLLKFFDKKQNDEAYNNPFYEDRDNDGDYETGSEDGLSEEADNVLCADTSVFPSEYLGTTPASIVTQNKYKLSFSGDYWIAHILGEDVWIIEEVCAKMIDCNYFDLAYTEDQYGNTTPPADWFDAGDYDGGGSWSGIESWSSDQTCDTSYGTGAKFYNGGGDFAVDSEFRFTLTLYLNGAPASDSILWWDTVVGTANAGDALTGVSGDQLYSHDDYDDSDLCNGGVGTALNPTWRAPVQETGNVASMYADVMGPVSGGTDFNTYVLDWPVVNVDYERLIDGDEISVVVEWGELPCGGGIEEEFCLVQVIDDCSSLVTPTSYCWQLRAPYGLGASNSGFWTGVAVTNYNTTTESEATINIYSVDGGSGYLETTIDPGGNYVGTVGQIVNDADWVDNDPALDPMYDIWILVEADTWIDGIIFVGDINTSFLHGYLFRSFTSCPAPGTRTTSALH